LHALVLCVDEYRQLINRPWLAYVTQTEAYPATVTGRACHRSLKDTDVIKTHSNARPSAAARIGLLVLLVLLGACSHLPRIKTPHWHAHWPWRHAPPAPEPAVNELVVETTAGVAVATLSQTWDRNTLRLALTGVAGEGELKLRPVQGHGWPIRLEFAVQPGSFAHLDLRGEQRVILTVPATGAVTVLPVPQGVFAPRTTELQLRYGP
jgi:hypothetical protein